MTRTHILIGLVLCITGCATSTVQYTDEQGRDWLVTRTNSLGSASAEDLMRLRVVAIHTEIATSCMGLLPEVSQTEKVFIDEKIANSLDELTANSVAEVFDQYSKKKQANAPELYQFCLEWMKTLKGFDPPNNPHAQSQRRPAQLSPSEVRAMPLSDYRSLLNAQYYEQQYR